MKLVLQQEYSKEVVTVYPLEEPMPLENFIKEDDKNLVDRLAPAQPAVTAADEPINADRTGVEADTYVYGDASSLKPALWSFREFVQNDAWKWYGGVVRRGGEPEEEIE
jgi:hypothetical protein